MSVVDEKPPEENLRSDLALKALSIVRNHQFLKERAMKQMTFDELVRSTDKDELAAMHKEKVEALMVYDPKRGALVASRFCSFHLAGFDLDEKSNAPLGQPYEPGVPLSLCSSMNVVSLRVVRAGPDYTYPVEVYGRVIARDEVDYKCVFLFDRLREDAQLINSEEDMLALTGPYRALVIDDFMYFEFDLKIKGKGEEDAEVQFSKGVIRYSHNPYDRRIIRQLPSFQSTVELVLQNVEGPVAASLEVSVVKKGPDEPIVHFNGKITVGTTRNYRHHMVIYDSTHAPSGGLVREDGSLVLNRNLVTAPEEETMFEEDKMTLYVCFLNVGCEIEDDDTVSLELEDKRGHEVGPEEEEEESEGGGDEEDSEGEGDEEDPKNILTLEYPICETVWEHSFPKLKVKVDWTTIFDEPLECSLARTYYLPKGFKWPDY